MKAFKGVTVFLALLAFAAAPAMSHCIEVGFKVTNDAGQLVTIPVTVQEREGGAFVQSANTLKGVGGYNFFIDYNHNCFGTNIVNLDVGTEYVINFHYPDSSGGVQSVCFLRESCTLSYDTFYTVTPARILRVSGTCEEIAWGYPDCTPVYPSPDLSVSLQIIDVNYIGDKIVFTLRATASGGTGSYTFAWSGAASTSPSLETNPNVAVRTILKSQTATVSVTVTSGTESVTKQILLGGAWIP